MNAAEGALLSACSEQGCGIAKRGRCLCSRGASAARTAEHLKNPEKPIRNAVWASTREEYNDQFGAFFQLLTVHKARGPNGAAPEKPGEAHAAERAWASTREEY